MADFEKVYSIKFDISKADKALDKLEDALKRIEKSGVFFQMQAISRVLKEIDKNADQAAKTIRSKLGREAQKDLNALGRSGKKAAKDLDEIPKAARRVDISLSAIGRNLNRYILAPLAAMSGLSIKAALDMNKGMANVSTLIDATPAKLQEMKREAQDTMVAMGKGTQDVTDGLYQVISALGQSEQNMQQLQGATKAAVAGLSDTKSSVEMLTAVAKAYNDTSAKSIEHTSDLAFQTVKLGVTTFPELAASIGKVAPLAAQFNTSQEELFGTMATLTGVTGSTAEVVTQLASAYAAFMNPSEEMDNALKKINKQNKEYNFSTIQAMVKTLGFKKSIELLGQEAGGSEEKLFKMFRRKEAILGILPLISSQSENYTKKVNAMRDAVGATNEAFRKQTEGINKQGFELEQTKQRIVVFGQRIGDRLIPMLGKAVEFGNRMLDWLDELDDDAIDTAISLGKVAAQFVLIVNAIRGLNAVANGVTSFLSIVNPGFATYSTQLSTATAKTNAFAASLSGLQKGVALLGALALGYTIGQLIQEGMIEPERKKEEKAASKAARRAIDATLRPEQMTDEQLEQEKKFLRKTYGQSQFVTQNTLRSAMTSAAELEEIRRLENSSLEGIASIDAEQRRRKAGISALDKYHSDRASKVSEIQFFEPNVVRNEQVRQATRDMELGGSYPDATIYRESMSQGYERQATKVLELNTNVTVQKGESASATANRIQRELARKLIQSGEF